MVKFEQASEKQINETMAFLKQKIYGSEGQSVADATKNYSKNNKFEEKDEIDKKETKEEKERRKLKTENIKTINDDKSKQRLYRMKVNDEIMNSASVEEKEYLFLDKFIDNIRDDNKTMVIYIDLVDVLEEHESSVLDLQMFD